MIITVGDQIFALNQEVKKLKRQCQQYEAALRELASGHGNSPKSVNNNSSVGRASLAMAEHGALLVK